MSLHYTQAGEASDEFDTEKKITSLKNIKINVAIIGGGLAGLAAFKRLQTIGFQKLDLFEASDRLGGRVYPIQFGNFWI
jgi:monoamine oxidase